MAIEIIKQEWCDPCLGEGTRSPSVWAEDITLGRLTRRLALCEQHEHLVVGFVDAFMNYGIKVDAPPKVAPTRVAAPPRAPAGTWQKYVQADGQAHCPVCEHATNSAGNLSKHVLAMHPEFDPFAERPAPVAPAARVKSAGRPPGKWDTFDRGNGMYDCPAGCGQVFNGPSGLGRHLTTKHPGFAPAPQGEQLAITA